MWLKRPGSGQSDNEEYDIYCYFEKQKYRLFDRIYESVWGEMYMGESRTVDHVQRMRKKLDWRPKSFRFIRLDTAWRWTSEIFLEIIFQHYSRDRVFCGNQRICTDLFQF
ncbi:MAG: helix-turn-helix domain-containing protein [Frisingicoccus sp.]